MQALPSDRTDAVFAPFAFTDVDSPHVPVPDHAAASTQPFPANLEAGNLEWST